ncbi:MAG: mitochondrial fission ELM1 family protein [Pseudomonadota bacterium]
MAEPGSLGPSIWAASDGRAGNAAQIRAVMAALSEPSRRAKLAHIRGENHRADPITLSPRAPWTWLPADRWPFPRLALPKAQRTILRAPWPTLWIAAGRRSAAFTKAVRVWSGGKTLCVQILDPRVDPGHFDLVVTPAHDGLEAPNVTTTIGSPAYFSDGAIAQAHRDYADVAGQHLQSAIVIVGGNSKTHRFTEQACLRLTDQLRVVSADGWHLRITTSRRTPDFVTTRLRILAGEIGADIWSGPEDGPNPYLAWLLHSDAAIVTEDSANMLSDAAYHGLPVHMARLDGQSEKFDRLHGSLIDRGVARWFDGALERWTYPPLREAERVADAIVESLIRRDLA